MRSFVGAWAITLLICAAASAQVINAQVINAQVINGEGTYEGSTLHDPPPEPGAIAQQPVEKRATEESGTQRGNHRR